MTRPSVRSGVTGTLSLLLVLAAESAAQTAREPRAVPGQLLARIGPRVLARTPSRAPHDIVPPGYRIPKAGMLRPELPSGPVVLPRLVTSARGHVRVGWIADRAPILLDTSDLGDPTASISAARRPRRVDPFPLLGADTPPVATPPDRLPVAPLPGCCADPEPALAASPTRIDVTPMLRLAFAPSGPRSVALAVPAVGEPAVDVRPSW